jgi:hypothetical protein
MKQTKEEIQTLKDSWMKDPCWDIEETEGFEEHVEELLAFRKEKEAEWTRQEEERIAKRARVVMVETGIVNSSVAQEVSTYREIEHAVASQDQYISAFSSLADQVKVELMQAQVRATLLMSAQMQRIADALEARNESEEATDNQDYMTRLYKVE